jgi:hypothetical protein
MREKTKILWRDYLIKSKLMNVFKIMENFEMTKLRNLVSAYFLTSRTSHWLTISLPLVRSVYIINALV